MDQHPDQNRSDGLARLRSDPETWGEPLSYVDLLTDPTVRGRIAKLIVQSTLKRARRIR